MIKRLIEEEQLVPQPGDGGPESLNDRGPEPNNEMTNMIKVI